jgi:hypothetical protein
MPRRLCWLLRLLSRHDDAGILIVSVAPRAASQSIADEVLSGVVRKPAHGNRPGSLSVVPEGATDVPDVSATGVQRRASRYLVYTFYVMDSGN